jgi:hypothetical protein
MKLKPIKTFAFMPCELFNCDERGFQVQNGIMESPERKSDKFNGKSF